MPALYVMLPGQIGVGICPDISWKYCRAHSPCCVQTAFAANRMSDVPLRYVNPTLQCARLDSQLRKKVADNPLHTEPAARRDSNGESSLLPR